MIKSLNPDASIPSISTARRDVLREFQNEGSKVRTLIRSITSKVALTTDIFTSKMGLKSFLGVTAHWIDDNWKPRSILLDFYPFTGNHTGRSLCEIFTQILECYDLSSNVFID